ncbi:MAG: hypothetical protein ACRECP_11565 [Methylocella sp.]
MGGAASKCRGKYRLPDVPAQRLSSSEAGKPLTFTPIRESSAQSQLVAATHDIVLPFDRDEEGALKLGEPTEAPDLGSAERRWGVSHHKWSRTMTFSRIAFIAIAVVAMVSGVGPVAKADDAARIKQCVADNQGEGQTATVVAAYCSCMSKKMSASETQSITTWENSHSGEQKACSAEAGAKKHT